MINSMTAKRMADFDAFDGDGSPGFGFNNVSPRASGDERRMRSSPSASASPSWCMNIPELEVLPEREVLSPARVELWWIHGLCDAVNVMDTLAAWHRQNATCAIFLNIFFCVI